MSVQGTFSRSMGVSSAQPPRASRPLLEPLEPRLLLDGAPTEQAMELFGTSPALFVENQGQWADDAVRYAFQGSGANVLFTDAGPVFQLLQGEPSEPGPTDGLPAPDDPDVRCTTFSVRFDGADVVAPVGLEQAETVHNYFVGDQADWRSNVPTYAVVAYEGLYEGIDLRTWGRRNSLKYEFHVAAGADPSRIRVSYDGVEQLSVDADGALHVQTELGELIDEAPYIYQEIGGERIEVAGCFVLLDADTCAFEISGRHDPSRPLVIDPDLAWSTYLGGRGDDDGIAVAVDASGNVHVTGETFSPGWVADGWDTSHNGSYDVFVAKLGPTGQHVWSTYLGGSSADKGEGIAVDGGGHVYVTGLTASVGWVFGGFDTTYNGGTFDAFVARVTSTGQHWWSSYLGGSGEDVGYDIAVDGAGDIHVTGSTESSGWVSGGYNTTYSGAGDGFVAKLSPTGQHVWSTYLGGGDQDWGNGIAVDGAENVYVTGETCSGGWVSAGWDGSYNGAGDGFVAKLGPGGLHRWSTYVGAENEDHGRDIALDGSGGVYVTGSTKSPGWAWFGFDESHNGGYDAFVATYGTDGWYLWGTYLGGSGSDTGKGIALDASGNVYVTGETGSSLSWVSDGFDTSYNGGLSDAFVGGLGPAGDHLWSTYLGGDASDSGRGIAVDGAGSVYVTGGTWSDDWVSGGYDTTYGGNGDGFVAKIAEGGGDLVPPRVRGVYVCGTLWSREFLDYLAPGPFGEDYGYRIPVGISAGSADQLDELPWVNTNQIRVLFSEDVTCGADSLRVFGLNTPEYGYTLSYDGVRHVATLTFDSPFEEGLAADRLLLVIDDRLTDKAGNRLDGEWTDALSTYPSGDGTAGGDFRFRLNVLPGDVDGSGEVRCSDVIKVRRKTNTTPGRPGYSPLYDVDGDAHIRSSDVIKVRRCANTQLPSGKPTAPPAAPLVGWGVEYDLIAAALGAARRDGGDRGLLSPLPTDVLSLAEIVPLAI